MKAINNIFIRQLFYTKNRQNKQLKILVFYLQTFAILLKSFYKALMVTKGGFCLKETTNKPIPEIYKSIYAENVKEEALFVIVGDLSL